MTALLEVSGLGVAVSRDGVEHDAVSDVSITLRTGECVGIVGESGSGKSLTLLGVLGQLPSSARITSGQVRRPGGGTTAMIFQDALGSLDPTMRVGTNIAKVVRRRSGCPRNEATRRAIELLASVGIPAPGLRARAFPHELSGGLRQRVAIALALASEPQVLLCDEPTTALDVTLQAQVIRLLKEIRRERQIGMIFVSHDIAVVRQLSDRIAVMYAGQMVEIGATDDLIERPRHPYTKALLASIPAVDAVRSSFSTIAGRPPDLGDYDAGCRFRTRCAHADGACASDVPGLTHVETGCACIHAGTAPDVVGHQVGRRP